MHGGEALLFFADLSTSACCGVQVTMVVVVAPLLTRVCHPAAINGRFPIFKMIPTAILPLTL